MIQLKELARALQLDKRTLQKYYEQGDIPMPTMDYRGWRYYTAEQAQQIEDFFYGWRYGKISTDDNINPKTDSKN